MSDDALVNGSQSRGYRQSVCFDRRAFAVFGAADGGAFFAKDGDAEVPDFVVDLAESGFGKFMGRSKFLFKLRRILNANAAWHSLQLPSRKLGTLSRFDA